MNKYLIYGLYCPITDNIHYIGKSSRGFIRPTEHMNRSHSIKISTWVESLSMLGYKPVVKILEECTSDNINEKEIYWIEKLSGEGEYLLNMTHNNVSEIIINNKYSFKDDLYRIGREIKKIRNNMGLSQELIAKTSNIDRKTLYRIECGHKGIVLSAILRVLSVLGYELVLKEKK